MCFIFVCYFKKWMSNNFSVEGEVVPMKIRIVCICINLGYYNLIKKIQRIIIMIVFQVKA